MIEKMLLFFFGTMVGDSERPYEVNDKKAGMLIASMVFTAYMVINWPAGWEMWATYMGAVGGWNVGSYAVKKIAAAKAGKSSEPSQ